MNCLKEGTIIYVRKVKGTIKYIRKKEIEASLPIEFQALDHNHNIFMICSALNCAFPQEIDSVL